MAKATKLDMINREKRIMELMANGADKTSLVEAVAKEFKIATRTVENQYQQVIKKMEKLVEEDRSELRANLMARQEAIYKRALETGALKVALDSTTAQAKLAGLNEKIEKSPERPKMITLKEKDFSGSLKAVPSDKDKAVNE